VVANSSPRQTHERRVLLIKVTRARLSLCAQRFRRVGQGGWCRGVPGSSPRRRRAPPAGRPDGPKVSHRLERWVSRRAGCRVKRGSGLPHNLRTPSDRTTRSLRLWWTAPAAATVITLNPVQEAIPQRHCSRTDSSLPRPPSPSTPHVSDRGSAQRNKAPRRTSAEGLGGVARRCTRREVVSESSCQARRRRPPTRPAAPSSASTPGAGTANDAKVPPLPSDQVAGLKSFPAPRDTA